jgi:hypothetical protein
MMAANDNVRAEDMEEIMAAVAVNLSSHIENLRLTEQTQRALSTTAAQAERLIKLNEMGAALGTAESLADIYRSPWRARRKYCYVDQMPGCCCCAKMGRCCRSRRR